MNNDRFPWDDNPPPGPGDDDFYDWYSDPYDPANLEKEWQGTRGNAWSNNGRAANRDEEDQQTRGYSGVWTINNERRDTSRVMRRPADYVPGQSIGNEPGLYAPWPRDRNDPQDRRHPEVFRAPRGSKANGNEYGTGYDTAQVWDWTRGTSGYMMGMNTQQGGPSQEYEARDERGNPVWEARRRELRNQEHEALQDERALQEQRRDRRRLMARRRQ